MKNRFFIFTGGAQLPRTPPVRTDRPLGEGGAAAPTSTPPCYGKKRAGGAGPVPNPSRTRREPVANPSRTLPEPVLKPYLIKTLLVEFGEDRASNPSWGGASHPLRKFPTFVFVLLLISYDFVSDDLDGSKNQAQYWRA